MLRDENTVQSSHSSFSLPLLDTMTLLEGIYKAENNFYKYIKVLLAT